MLRPSRPALRLVHGKLPPAEPCIDQPHDELAAVATAAMVGHESAVRTFVLTIGPHILRVVRKVLGPQHPDIDDVAQECVFEVVDALPKWRGESTVMHDIVVIQDERDNAEKWRSFDDALQSKTRSWFGGSMTRVTTRQESRLDPAVVLAPSSIVGRVRPTSASYRSDTVLVPQTS